MTQELEGLRVEHAALDGAAADMYATVMHMDERLSGLEAELAPLRTQWAGAQQDAYQRAKAQWDAAMGRMRDLLDESRRAVATSNADYAAADQRGAARFDF